MKSKTKEEIEAEIEIHKRTGAHRKVELLEERLAEVCGSVQSVDESKPDGFSVAVHETYYTEESAESIQYEGSAHPIEQAYFMKRDTVLSWKEITEKTGVKTPWLKVKKFAKDNDLPYNA